MNTLKQMGRAFIVGVGVLGVGFPLAMHLSPKEETVTREETITKNEKSRGMICVKGDEIVYQQVWTNDFNQNACRLIQDCEAMEWELDETVTCSRNIGDDVNFHLLTLCFKEGAVKCPIVASQFISKLTHDQK